MLRFTQSSWPRAAAGAAAAAAKAAAAAAEEKKVDYRAVEPEVNGAAHGDDEKKDRSDDEEEVHAELNMMESSLEDIVINVKCNAASYTREGEESTDSLLDSGASRSVVNRTVKLLPGTMERARGYVYGSNPSASPARISAKGFISLMGRKTRVYVGNVPKSVLSVIAITIDQPLSIKWIKGVCVVKDYERKEISEIPPSDGLTKLPRSMLE